MLGHSDKYESSFFSISSSSISSNDEIFEILVNYATRDSQIADFYAIFKNRITDFLHVFNGVEFEVPSLNDKVDLVYTFLPEIQKLFGDEVFKNFLITFSGTTVKVPDINYVKNTLRDVDIFVRMSKCQTKSDRLAVARQFVKHYKITIQEAHWSNRRVKKEIARRSN